MYRLSRQEMRIIEQTRREGEELQRQEEEAAGAPARKGIRLWSLLALAAIFILFAFGIRLLIELLSN